MILLPNNHYLPFFTGAATLLTVLLADLPFLGAAIITGFVPVADGELFAFLTILAILVSP
jgi:hypothetical protein